VKGKLTKISKSSFKKLLEEFSTNEDSSKLLGHYLAGLIEGDGSIIVPKTIRNQKGKKKILKKTVLKGWYIFNNLQKLNIKYKNIYKKSDRSFSYKLFNFS